MSSRRSVGSQIVFNNPRAISVRSGGSKTSNSTINVTLARRLLFPYLPLTTPLPPLVGTYGTPEENEKRRNDPAFKALNNELYDFLALVVRGFVLPWWSKITPRDKEFPQEITRIAASLIKQVESRAMAADIPALLANAIPLLVAQHYQDFRLAQAKLPTSYATGLQGHSDSLPHLFHSFQPHMAVTAEGTVDPNYLRQVVEHIMKACLPPEDWEAEAERAIIREIVLKILLESAFPRLSQPWFIQKTMLELLGPPKETVPPPPVTRSGSAFHTFVILFLSAVQVVSGFAIAAIAGLQATLHTVTEVNASTFRQKTTSQTGEDMAFPTLEMLAEILNMRERAAAAAILYLLQLILGALAPFVNRLVPYLFYTHTHPSMFTKILAQSKKVLFPDGYPGPPPVEPTIEEQVLIREQLEKRLFDCVFPVAAKLLFGTKLSIQGRTIRGILDPLGSKQCNVHLLIFLLDAIVVSLFPELALSPTSKREPSDGATDADLDAMIYSPYDKSDPLDGRSNSPGQGTP
ncbi:SubName: Full=Uncharacterized protein {ECO:0000313/EMBL:CCA70162.1} [Serendipita indica DSM 11827]|uniref:PXA domain-containing protein n=1 Tax=Serendipita indica (strain DSM 11827) TaxID=1109443 RepID=G4TFR5_SERID|nr:SubName: Full=Uncharacterized protein {ECO:0000313/EMBL:CCA70162.1} [Serendipita indica DSM 11827]CCA70162.1 hypothetical protein PIIN_04101 [Serendipita indica DSM 11827]